MASDDSTGILRRYLKRLGYASHPWLLGRNLGAPNFVRERLVDRAAELYARYERKISIVGWSLGGIYAREIAKLMPTRVRQVITLGSPFGDVSRPTSFSRFFEYASGRDLASEMPEQVERIRSAPPVPSTAIYSKSDGITHWRVLPRGRRPGPREHRGHRQPLRPRLEPARALGDRRSARAEGRRLAAVPARRLARLPVSIAPAEFSAREHRAALCSAA